MFSLNPPGFASEKGMIELDPVVRTIRYDSILPAAFHGE
jgi:hypothetical protein